VQPKIFAASDHDIDPILIDPDAIQVITALRDAGYAAYLVGGSVRDLLVKKKPKDFDISTSARPEEIKYLFKRQCLLIGRRFRLAHIRFGHKVFEVATFRSGDITDTDLIVRDNQWGSPEEDALRRDFTINGLFYDPANHQVIDYVGGWNDIHSSVLRTIGDPEIRFKQDPVRMIRALKFRARFNFSFDEETDNALNSCKGEIIKSSPARILEEIFRMLESGASAPFFLLMTQYGLIDILFPALRHFLTGPYGNEIYQYLSAADRLLKSHEKIHCHRAVLACCLLYPILLREIDKQFLSQKNTPHLGDITLLSSSLVDAILSSSFSHFPRRISAAMIFVLTTQFRFTPLTHKRHFRPQLLKDKDFPLALQFLKIRSLVDTHLSEDYTHWKTIYRRNRSASRKKSHPGPEHRIEHLQEG
jgi:poly(A) polymerase